mmetsp:Transcript_27372/g.81544  ORF Transcript_27372/g.81544 Transcript_27372/m.81544 type:complete len:383 (-) Transcript_27372:2-1150(-)
MDSRLWLSASRSLLARQGLEPAGEGAAVALAQSARPEREAGGDDDGAGNEVAERHRQEVVQDHELRGDGRAREEARRQQEHVRDGVLEADGDEHGDREPDAHHLAGEVVRLGAEVHRHAHEPVAHDGLHNGDPEAVVALLGDGGNGQVRSAAREQLSVPRHDGHRAAADDVANPREDPAPEDLETRRLALVEGHGEGRGVAREELRAALEHKQEVHGEERGEDEPLGGDAGGNHVAGDGERQEAGHADVEAAVDRRVQGLQDRHLRVTDTLLHEGLVGLRRRLHHHDLLSRIRAELVARPLARDSARGERGGEAAHQAASAALEALGGRRRSCQRSRRLLHLLQRRTRRVHSGPAGRVAEGGQAGHRLGSNSADSTKADTGA